MDEAVTTEIEGPNGLLIEIRIRPKKLSYTDQAQLQYTKGFLQYLLSHIHKWRKAHEGEYNEQ